jgi:hypothetical protein
MIVFPLRRSVGFKAATASSRVAGAVRDMLRSTLRWPRPGSQRPSLHRGPHHRLVPASQRRSSAGGCRVCDHYRFDETPNFGDAFNLPRFSSRRQTIPAHRQSKSARNAAFASSRLSAAPQTTGWPRLFQFRRVEPNGLSSRPSAPANAQSP